MLPSSVQHSCEFVRIRHQVDSFLSTVPFSRKTVIGVLPPYNLYIRDRDEFGLLAMSGSSVELTVDYLEFGLGRSIRRGLKERVSLTLYKSNKIRRLKT